MGSFVIDRLACARGSVPWNSRIPRAGAIEYACVRYACMGFGSRLAWATVKVGACRERDLFAAWFLPLTDPYRMSSCPVLVLHRARPNMLAPKDECSGAGRPGSARGIMNLKRVERKHRLLAAEKVLPTVSTEILPCSNAIQLSRSPVSPPEGISAVTWGGTLRSLFWRSTWSLIDPMAPH